MEYEECIDFLFSQLPMYQRDGVAAYKEDLNNTLALAELTGNPQNKLKTVHIAGTNGKGSTAHLIASVLQEQGYKVGLYTSPHLKDFRERIRINGKMIPHDDVVNFVELFQTQWQDIQPSFFEITVAMAFWYFKNEKIDIGIIETGLGGRLDSTNIITPEVSVITNISLDHTNLLGNSIEEIAFEKSGIIKKNVPVVLGKMVNEAENKIRLEAIKKNAKIYFAEEADDVIPESDLKGIYQIENRKTALTTLKVLRQNGWKIDFNNVNNGFHKVQENTEMRGRWQQLGTDPLIIADCGHNIDGVSAAMHQLSLITHKNLHIILGMVSDKDISSILELLPKNATYYFCKANINRALKAKNLMELGEEIGLKGETYASVSKAYEAARLYAEPEDLIFIGGSVFVVGEII